MYTRPDALLWSTNSLVLWLVSSTSSTKSFTKTGEQKKLFVVNLSQQSNEFDHVTVALRIKSVGEINALTCVSRCAHRGGAGSPGEA